MMLPSSLFRGSRGIHLLGKKPCYEFFGKHTLLLTYRQEKDSVKVDFFNNEFGTSEERSNRQLALEIVQGLLVNQRVRAYSSDGFPDEFGTMLNLGSNKSFSTRVSCKLTLAPDLFSQSGYMRCYLSWKQRLPYLIREHHVKSNDSESEEAFLYVFSMPFDEYIPFNESACEELITATREITPTMGMVIPSTVTAEGGVTDAVFEITHVDTDRVVSGYLHMVDNYQVQSGLKLTHSVFSGQSELNESDQEFSCNVGVITDVGEVKQICAAHL